MRSADTPPPPPRPPPRPRPPRHPPHPTAVDVTLRALRARHPTGALWVAFEPRSATACRALHQEAYAHAFDAADHVLLAPLGRTNVPAAEALDLARLVRELGPKA